MTAQNVESPKDVRARIDEYLSLVHATLSLVAKSVVLFTLLGAAMSFSYFLSIGYVPTTSLADLSAIFLTTASIGALSFALLSLSTVAIGLAWRETARGIAGREPDVARRPRRERVVVAVLTVSYFVTLLLVIGVAVLTSEIDKPASWPLVMAAAVFLLAPAPLMWKGSLDLKGALRVSSTIAAGVLCGVLVLSLWMMIATERWSAQAAPVQYFNLIVASVLISVSPAVAVFADRKLLPRSSARANSIGWFVLVAVAASFILLLLSGFTSFSRTVMRYSGAGIVNGVTMAVSSEGREALELLLGRNACRAGARGELCVLEEIDVLWGRGAEVLVSIPVSGSSGGVDDERVTTRRRVVLPRAHVNAFELP